MSYDFAAETSTLTKPECVRGCITTACCEISRQGGDHYLCLAQMRKRLGEEPEPGDMCGTCGTRLE